MVRNSVSLFLSIMSLLFSYGAYAVFKRIAPSSKIIVCLSPLHITETTFKTLPHHWEKKHR